MRDGDNIITTLMEHNSKMCPGTRLPVTGISSFLVRGPSLSDVRVIADGSGYTRKIDGDSWLPQRLSHSPSDRGQ